MSPKPTILGWSSFIPSTSPHGGNVRTEQITELVAKAGFTYEVIARTPFVYSLADRLHGLISKNIHRKKWRNISAGLLGYYRGVLTQKLRSHVGPKIILCEDTILPVPLWYARPLGFKVIALPHNVETLIGAPSNLDKIRSELAAMRQADAIFCISDEDAWFWSNLGLDAQVLPYFPIGARRLRLEKIAAIRRVSPPTPDAPWLILGTVHHTPTREGILTVLRWLKPALEAGHTLIIAGHGTADLTSEAVQGVTIAGTVSEDELDTLRLRARGLIVHQDRGTGALTRIPEASAAGIPVLANRIAARSTAALPNVMRYDNAEELIALVNKPMSHTASQPTSTSAEFITTLQTFARSY